MSTRPKEHVEFASRIQEQGASVVEADLAAQVSQLYEQRRKEHRELNQELLQLFGIPYIVAPTEAEAQCATLVQLGLVDGVVTDDSDIFLFGGTAVYRHVFQSHRHVDDYTDGIPGIGRVTAMEVLSEWQGPHGLAAFRDWLIAAEQGAHTQAEIDAENAIRRRLISIDPAFPDPRVAAAYTSPNVDDSPESFQRELPDLDGIRWYMSRKVDWEQAKVDERVLPIIRRLNEFKKESQAQLDRYFRIDSERLKTTQTSSRVRKAVARLMPAANAAARPGAKKQRTRIGQIIQL
ncbi:hypothetical protein SYNPS1DRAFT_25568 [Syncephalis pseudoplumigaleata]|uniref:XPG-I domain-containing protein n=1 Tax=Syncephalis pseudoplumigaleata TaxID=1712513 RepID=A0A4P9YSE0_9FUNG|nr:hypothetical protein SYNPS1DRAFT_25568 [Syncephalis pseudoplumigaleata]|eukprot:RKP22625.1 hypothetical protein SYNPS1DRAFT_25568 [Syncephalis pseudoplumigaleata]